MNDIWRKVVDHFPNVTKILQRGEHRCREGVLSLSCEYGLNDRIREHYGPDGLSVTTVKMYVTFQIENLSSKARHSGSCLLSQLLGKLSQEDLQFKVNKTLFQKTGTLSVSLMPGNKLRV